MGKVRRVQHLPYGADEPKAGLVHAAAAFLKTQKLGRYALYCGGMYRNYGFWTMLDAFIKTARMQPDFSAVLLGRGPEKEAGQAYIVEAGLKERIRFPGFVPEQELQLYLAGAAVHVSPLNDTITDRARCPSKIPMYMMMGRPVVTCRVGEAWEYLGDHGYYYKPGDTVSLASVLEEIWCIKTGSVIYDLEKITWRSIAARYSEFWSYQLQEYRN
jgi:glycosyltransferase involved in cell wall biosynthesis